MGEEKPDEELMGKRKPSPRLSTTSLDADILRIAETGTNIHRAQIFFANRGKYDTIASDRKLQDA